MSIGSAASRPTFAMPVRFFFPSFEMASSFKSYIAAALRLLVHNGTVQVEVGLAEARSCTWGIMGQCFRAERFRTWVTQTSSDLTADVLLKLLVPSLNASGCGIRILFLRRSKIAIYQIIRTQRGGGVVARRIIDVHDERAFHHYLLSHEIPEEERRQLRVASKVLVTWLKLYEQLRIRRIYLDAGLSAGGRLWPKYGFRPIDGKEWLNCRKRIMFNLRKTEPHIREEFRPIRERFDARSEP